MPELILGPMLRYLDESQATVWVETDGPCGGVHVARQYEAVGAIAGMPSFWIAAGSREG